MSPVEMSSEDIVRELRTEATSRSVRAVSTTSVNGSDETGLEAQDLFDAGDRLGVRGERQDPNETLVGVRHQVEEGGSLTAIAYQRRARAVISHRLVLADGSEATRTMVYEVDATPNAEGDIEDGGRVFLLAKSVDGIALEFSAASECSSNQDCGPTYCYRCECTSWDLTCLANCCVPCAFSCGNAWLCLACIGVWCSACSSDLLNGCCQSTSCTYRPGTQC